MHMCVNSFGFSSHFSVHLFSECNFSLSVVEGIMYYSLCLLFYTFSALPRQYKHHSKCNFFIGALSCSFLNSGQINGWPH